MFWYAQWRHARSCVGSRRSEFGRHTFIVKLSFIFILVCFDAFLLVRRFDLAKLYETFVKG